MTTLIIDRRHPLRDATERMIRQTYRDRFDATLGALPNLLATYLSPDGLPAAACSIRFAEHGFFSTIYLDMPLEDTLLKTTGQVFKPCEVMEIGTLAGLRAGSAFALIDAAIAFGRGMGKTIGLFTATEALRRGLVRAGRPPIDLGPAMAERLGEDRACWGRYYETSPRVCALIDSAEDAIRLARVG